MSKSSSPGLEKELHLSYFTLENLQEAVIWVDAEGAIFQVNGRACQLSGYTREELTGMHVIDINPTRLLADFNELWLRLKKEKKIVFEAQHRHKSGYLYDVEISGNYIEYKGQEFICSIIRDLRKKKMEEQLLRIVSEVTCGLTGHDFLIELTKKVTSILDMRYGFIAECA